MPIQPTEQRPLRIAIVGAGPAGFYAAAHLLKQQLPIKIDMIEKLPTPFGLVRYGVAPDHEKIKSVIKVFEKTAEHPRFSYYGNVSIGQDVSIDDLKKFYDGIIFSYGAEVDRRLGIPGENLEGCYTATEFVGWYNGHPNFQDHQFDLSHDVAVIMGQGNVAMDVARILCSTVDELKKTDISQHALDVLAGSNIKEVHMFGRRGPLQASFAIEELKEMGDLADCVPVVDPKDLVLTEAAIRFLDNPDQVLNKKRFDILKRYSVLFPVIKKKKFFLHFNHSPIRINGQGHVDGIKFEINELTQDPLQPKVVGTGQFENFPCSLFLTSIGYMGVPMPGLPFSGDKGLIPNKMGRVIDGDHVIPGCYVAGWIKRGPNGVIGINKSCAEETVHSLLEDLAILTPCQNPSSQEFLRIVQERGFKPMTFSGWKKIDLAEINRGLLVGKPREKFTNIQEMLDVALHQKNN